jgi:GNAT superfamily N-acetyltransferase
LGRAFTVRRSRPEDIEPIERLLREWLRFTPASGRTESFNNARRKKELLVAESGSKVVGFIHFVVHNDIIDGAPNSFITAFYVSSAYRNVGIGSALLHRVIADSVALGVVSIETSTFHGRAEDFYLKHGFKQSREDAEEVFLELDVQQK